MIGKTLNHYEIIEPLGAGGMGEVYRAHDTTLKRDVAIKVLPSHLASDETAMARFRREAEMLAAVNHPGIATIFSIEESEGTRFLVLELVEGETLATRLDTGPLPLEESLEISRQIANALEAAHAQRIVHRDLKPANIMLSAEGRVKVLDFGLALPFQLGQGTDLTQASTDFNKLTATGTFMGTAPYMSPEQVRGQAVDPRTDIWAFGCVLFEMLAGRRAFLRNTMADTMAAILARDPEWGELPDDTSPAIRALIRKSLQKETDERLQDMSHACLEIQEVLTSGTAAETSAKPARRKRGLSALAAVGVLSLVLLTAAIALNVGDLRDLVMRVPWGVGAVTVAGSGERPRIVVLPFENLGGDEEEYFSEGITHDISTQISKIGNFAVIAHGSARRASSAGGGYREMAQQLGVDYIIDGSVSHAGDRVRITASLIDPETDEQLWANDYDRELSIEHIFNVRSNVAQQVAGALNVTLSPADQLQLSEQPTQNLEAYQQYQLGRFFWNKRTVEGFELAVGHFEQAIALDPDYALAHAGLADTHLLLPWFSSQYSNELGLARSEESARAALDLDPSLGEAHATLGLVYEWQFRWDAAEREFKRAIELSPVYATAHHWYADMLARLGRHEEAVGQINTALELDPLSLIINQDVGFVLHHAGQTEAAIRQYRRTLELEPTFPATRLLLAITLLAEGEFGEAENELGRWAEVTGNDPVELRHLTELAARHARSGETQTMPPALELDAMFPPFAVSALYLLTGHHQTVLDRFEQAYEENLFAVAFALTWPPFERLNYDPRYAELKRRMGFE